MKNTVLISIICAVAGLTACSNSIKPESWMSGIPDETPAWQLSLPGAHDAATSGIPEGTVQHLAHCTQSYTLAEQFDKGIRFFDIRPGFDGDDLSRMMIMHSTTNTGVSADEALAAITGKVRENPSEFAIIVFRIENNDFTPEVLAAAQDSLCNLERKYAAQGVVMESFKAGMSVGDMRGKVLLINRNDYGSRIWCGAHTTGWDGMCSIISPDGTQSAGIFIQDDYGWDDDGTCGTGKAASFAKHAAEFARKSAMGECWGVNHVSGYFNRDGLPRPHEFAEAVAPEVCKWLSEDKGNSPLGGVMIDYAGDPAYMGDEIIRLVIERNFKPAAGTDDGIQLFNGTDLTGWDFVLADPAVPAADVFSVKDGVIEIAGQPFGYMYTLEEYENYELSVEWRWPAEPTNSGVFLNIKALTNPFPNCVEHQLQAGNAGQFLALGGSKIEGVEAPEGKIGRKERMADSAEKEPGEWNKAVITVVDGNISTYVNGVFINECRDMANGGHIALQSEGGPIQFRNVILKQL